MPVMHVCSACDYGFVGVGVSDGCVVAEAPC